MISPLKTKLKTVKQQIKTKSVYVNTLFPNFEFTNKNGIIIKRGDCCIPL